MRRRRKPTRNCRCVKRFEPQTELRDFRKKQLTKRKRTTTLSSTQKVLNRKLFQKRTKKEGTECETRLTRATAPQYELQIKLQKKYPDRFKSTSVKQFVCHCGHIFDPAKHHAQNWQKHFKLCDKKRQKRINFFGVVKPTTKNKTNVSTTFESLDPAVVCDGLWNRTVCGVDVAGLYGVSTREFHGEPGYVFSRKDISTGAVTRYHGTFRSTQCLKVAVMSGSHKPNGTSTCNFCSRLIFNKQFQKYIESTKSKTSLKYDATSKFVRNDLLTLSQAKTKLSKQALQIRILQQYRYDIHHARHATVSARNNLPTISHNSCELVQAQKFTCTGGQESEGSLRQKRC